MLVSTQECVWASISSTSKLLCAHQKNPTCTVYLIYVHTALTLLPEYSLQLFQYLKKSSSWVAWHLDHVLITHRLPFNPQKHNLSRRPWSPRGCFIVEFLHLNTSILSLTFSPTHSRWRDRALWKAEQTHIQSSQTDKHLLHNSSEEDHVSHLKTSSAVYYQLWGTCTYAGNPPKVHQHHLCLYILSVGTQDWIPAEPVKSCC